MFYCNKCAKENGYPETIFKSIGVCELCGHVTECNDMLSSELPPKVDVNDKYINSYCVGIGKVDGEGKPLFLSTKRIKYGKYPIIDIPADGKPKWMGGAFALYFVYSKRNGNFILRGYSDEVEKYLKKNYTHYFFYNSLWSNGRSRGHWQFWKDGIYITAPSKHGKTWKYTVVRFKSTGRFNSLEELKYQKEIRLTFKRLPKQWIPEFDQL
jgi:hypothetical protein